MKLFLYLSILHLPSSKGHIFEIVKNTWEGITELRFDHVEAF